MTWQAYLAYFQQILVSDGLQPPYNEEDFYNYTKLNWSRTNRWLKQSPITDETKAIIEKIATRQKWVVITEPWCGDAAHIVPVIYLMSRLNNNIELEIQLRDTDSEIDKYLTNGSKSVPILVVRDENGKDIFIWGPRPQAAKELFQKLKADNASFEDIKLALQNFYNSDKAIAIQKEISEGLK